MSKGKDLLKRSIVIILSVCMITTMCPFISDGWNGSGHADAATKGTAKAMVDQAEKYEGISSLASVKKSMKKRGYTLYNPGYSGDWCAWFVANCARQSGSKTDVIPNMITCDRTWCKTKKIYKKSLAWGGTKYTPVAGDLLYFTWNQRDYAEHIGIVRYTKNGYVHTIEGNSGNAVKYRSYGLKDGRILGYAHPKYKTASCSHSWNNKGVCTKCKVSYSSVENLDKSYATNGASKAYKLKSDAYLLYWPDSSSGKVLANVIKKGELIKVYGKVGSYYKIEYGWNKAIGYIPTSQATTYTQSSSPSSITISLKDFSMKQGAKEALHGEIFSANAVRLIEAQIKSESTGKVVLKGNTDYTANSFWKYFNLYNLNSKLNNGDLKNLSILPNGVYQATVTAKDIFGATKTATSIITVGGVNAPIIEEPQPEDESLKVKITTTHTGGTTEYAIGHGDFRTLNSSNPYITITEGNTAEDGAVIIKARTKKDGLVSSVQTKLVYLNKLEPPVIDVIQQGETGIVTLSQNNKATIMYKIGDGQYRDYSETGPFPADNGVSISAYAKKPGTIKSDVSTYETDYTEPDVPEIKMLNSETAVAAGKTVAIAWEKDSKAESFKASLFREDDEENAIRTLETSEATASFTLEQSGKYYVVVTARNALGESEESNRLEISAKDPLTIEFYNSERVDEETGELKKDLLTSVTVDYGECVSAIKAPTKRGHTFIGWENKETGTVSSNEYAKVPVKTDTVYIARYEKKTYKVKLYDPAGALIPIDEVEFEGDAVTQDVLDALQDRGFVNEAKKVSGWSIIKTSDPDSKADVHCIDSDMEAQAIVEWENQQLPIHISINDVNVSKSGSGTIFRPEVRILSDETKDTEIYLVASLKGTDADSGVEKTLFSDRRLFSIPIGDEGLSLNQGGSDHDFDLAVLNSDAANAVTKIEITAFERKEDGKTGSLYSDVASKDINQGDRWSDPVGPVTEKPQEAENRQIESWTQYKYRDKEYQYGGRETLEGYQLLERDIPYGAIEYGYWRVPEFAESSTVTDEYKIVKTQEEKEVYRSCSYYCDCKRTYWKEYSTSRKCHTCGGTLTNGLSVYSYTGLPATGYTQVVDWGGFYVCPKTIGIANPDKFSTIYVMGLGGGSTTEFTSGSDAIELWPDGTKKIHRLNTQLYRNKFWRWGEWSDEWSDTEVIPSSTREVQTRTVYTYSDLIEGPPVVEHLEGTIVHKEGTIDVDEDLSGKKAVVMAYQTNNTDPNKYQMQYTGKVTIGEDNSYSIDFIPMEDPKVDSGNYIIVLGIEGRSGLITIGVVDAPKKEHTVKLCYVDDNQEEQILSEQTVNDGDDVDLSEITVPEKKGYLFKGWSERTTNITKSAKIRAEYLSLPNTVVLVDWIHQTIEMQTAMTGDPIRLPDSIEDTEGYHFKGWKLEDGTELPNEIVVNDNMIIIADYDTKAFEVRFHGADGNVIDTQTIEYGESADPPVCEVSSNVGKFVGWSTNRNWWNVFEDVDVYPIINYSETIKSPVANIIADEETGAKTVELSTEDESATIYYTTDETLPTEDLIKEYLEKTGNGEEYDGSIRHYTEPIAVSENEYIIAVAYVEGKNESEPCVTFVDIEDEAVYDEDGVYAGDSQDYTEISTIDTKVKAGKDIVIQVDLEENPGLIGYDIRVDCDREIFYADVDEYDVPAVNSGEVSNDGMIVPSQDDSGWRVLWRSDSKSEVTGNLFELTLHTDENAEEGTYPITVSYAPRNTMDEDYDAVELEKVKVTINSEACIPIDTLDATLSRTSYVYEGEAFEPTVRIDGLREDTDFTVKYEDNVDVGTAKAIITGIGDYTGTLEKEFTITQANIANAEIAEMEDVVKTGEAIEPEIPITFNGKELEKDKDYEATFADNTEVGTATVEIKGIGNFKGTTETQFNIIETAESRLAEAEARIEELTREKENAEADVATAQAAQAAAEAQAQDAQSRLTQTEAELAEAIAAKRAAEADANASEAAKQAAEARVAELTEAKEKAEADLIEANAAKAAAETALEQAQNDKDAAAEQIEQLIREKEELEKQLAEAKKISIAGAEVKGIKPMTYSGKELKQTLAVTVKGKSLTEGKDYTVSYKNNIKVGKAVVMIEGTGEYKEDVTRTFSINPAGTTITKCIKGSKKATVKWRKQVTQTTGYQIRYSMKKNFKSGVKTVNVTKPATTKKVIKKLKTGKKYYFQIRTCKKVGTQYFYSGWSKAKAVKVK